MKKLYVTLFICLFGLISLQAQYTALYNFAPASGYAPYGSLSLLGGKWYGMTYYGGTIDRGVIFSIDTNGNNYDTLHNFAINTGYNPLGSLSLKGKKWYGMTYAGGTNNAGVIFSIDTNGSNYTVLHAFGTGSDGQNPWGNLTFDGKKCFGMTLNGGTHVNGVIFSMDTNGSHYQVIYNFYSYGEDPYGSFTLIGNRLYGMTENGGTYGNGVIFSIDTNGNNYDTLHNFGTGADGQHPFDDLTLVGNKFFGTTAYGGAHGYGSVFSVDTNGSNYKNIYGFSGYPRTGYQPYGSLTIIGNKCYGMAEKGGQGNGGMLFSVDTDGNNYDTLHCFGYGSDGSLPYGNLSFIGNKCYGMTSEGGAGSGGIIFSFIDSTLTVPNTTEFNKATNNKIVSLFPNPNNGVFTIESSVVSHQPSVGTQNFVSVQIYNVLGEKIYSNALSIEHLALNINLSGQPSGIYIYRVLSDDGKMAITGKFVIEK